jgi:hypothetical protein
MDPNHPQEYQFIMNNVPNKKGSPFGDTSTVKGRIMFVSVSGIFIITVLVVGFIAFSALTAKKLGDLKDISARQTELLRIIELGLDQSRSGSTKNYLVTVKSVLSTDKAKLSSYNKKNDINLSPQEQSARKDKDTDKALDEAAKKNLYDEVLVDAVNKQLLSYDKALRAAYEENETSAGRKLIKTAADNTATILTTK